jgi:hypothetical protein
MITVQDRVKKSEAYSAFHGENEVCVEDAIAEHLKQARDVERRVTREEALDTPAARQNRG